MSTTGSFSHIFRSQLSGIGFRILITLYTHYGNLNPKPYIPHIPHIRIMVILNPQPYVPSVVASFELLNSNRAAAAQESQ